MFEGADILSIDGLDGSANMTAQVSVDGVTQDDALE